MEEKYKRLEEYGVIGNLETCALVGADGSVDWLCLPHLESPSAFSALLDSDRGGHFRIRPTEKYRSVQNYIDNTNVLKTTFYTAMGIASVTDFMPVKTIEAGDFVSTLFRKVQWIEKGEAELELDFRPRFDYAREMPLFYRTEGGVVAQGRDHALFFHSPVHLELDRTGARGIIRAREGTTLWFVLQYNSRRPLSPDDCEGFLNRTGAFWRNWAHNCDSPDCLFAGPWHELIVRSGLILKMLTNSDNGAIAAAATTSLPEVIGGVRNWDYRFSWIRDSALTVQALYHLGHEQEAEHFRAWISSIVDKAHDISKLRILYPLRDGDAVPEQILENLAGYRNSGPVRIGNKAADQKQMDIYGELINTLYETTRYGADIPESRWHMVKSIVEHVCKTWGEKDSGIWEARSEPEEYTYSKLMCWVALNRGIKIALRKGFDAPLDAWHAAASAVRKAILNKGFSKRRNSFVRSFGSEDLDATGLQIPFTGFLPFGDERVQGTIDAIMQHLMAGEGLVMRYRAEDGLPGSEGSFVLCSSWLVKALSLSGRQEEAERLFTKILDYMSPLGLISEEIDPVSGMLLGNMPQAFSHIGIINAALHIGIGKGKRHRGPEPMGEENREKGGERWREHYQHHAEQL